MSTGHLSVHCIGLLQRGQGPLGCVRIYVHGLLHTLGFGKGVLTWAYYRAASKSALFLDLFVKADFPVFK